MALLSITRVPTRTLRTPASTPSSPNTFLARVTPANTTQQRAFHATPPAHRARNRRTHPLSLLPADAPPCPPYPYPAARWFKQSNVGLYGGSAIQFGNNVSEEFQTKTPRQWYPNVQRKAVYSRALGRWLRVRVTTRVLRTIDKVGGLDEYVLGGGAARIKELGPEGWKLRWAVLNAARTAVAEDEGTGTEFGEGRRAEELRRMWAAVERVEEERRAERETDGLGRREEGERPRVDMAPLRAADARAARQLRQEYEPVGRARPAHMHEVPVEEVASGSSPQSPQPPRGIFGRAVDVVGWPVRRLLRR